MATEREQKRQKAVDDWTNTPSPNPRYKGLTPNEVGRKLLKKGERDPARKQIRR